MELTYWDIVKLSHIHSVLRNSDTWEATTKQIEDVLREEAMRILWKEEMEVEK